MALEIIQEIDSYFTFRIEGEHFAINAGNVLRIVEMMPVTRVPNSPKYFKGIINLLGQVIPIFDGRLKFGFQENEYTKSTCMLILAFELDGQDTKAGIIIDSVGKVIMLNAESIKPSSSEKIGISAKFIQGITIYNDEPLKILNIENVFS